MRGLMIKDLYCLKQNIKSLIFVLVIWGIVFLPRKHGGMGLISLCMIMGVMQILTLASYDKQAKWDTCALSMPLTRADMVREKYIMTLLILVIPAAISSVLVYITWMIQTGGRAGDFIPDIALTLVMSAGIGLAYAAISIPIFLWLDVEKARYIPIILFAIIFFFSFMLVDSYHSWDIHMEDVILFSIWTLFISAVLFVISYFISIKIYKRKDF